MLVKKWIIAVLVLGLLVAVAVETIEQLTIESRTISNWSDVASQYYEARYGLPPIPTPVPYRDVLTKMSTNDWSFLATPFWNYDHDGGTHERPAA